MPEIYRGVKFKVKFLEKCEIKDKRIRKLASWCRIFAARGLAPRHAGGSAGNLSYRAKKGFIITASGTNLNHHLAASDFVQVVGFDFKKNTTTAIGKKNPSSETGLHAYLYSLNKKIKAIFHGHSELILKNAKRLGIPVTERSALYGSLQLAKLAGETLRTMKKSSSIFVLKNHGFISFGRNMSEAGERAKKALQMVSREPKFSDRVPKKQKASAFRERIK